MTNGNISNEEWERVRDVPAVQEAEAAFTKAAFNSTDPSEWVFSQAASRLYSRLASARLRALLQMRREARLQADS